MPIPPAAASETTVMGTTAEITWVNVAVRGEALGAFRAFVFDIDGVVTDTTGLHKRAWQTVFDRHLADLAVQSRADAVRFDSEIDYPKYLDGRPRFDATRDVLGARGISLPFGEPADSPGTATVCALANAKNREFLRLAGAEGVRSFPSTVGLLQRAPQRRHPDRAGVLQHGLRHGHSRCWGRRARSMSD